MQSKSNSLMMRILLCIIFISVVVFSSHVFIQIYVKLLTTILSNGMLSSNGQYPNYVTLVAGITAIIPVTVWTLIYYYAGHLIPFKNKLFRILFVLFILLESHGLLIRYPIVSYLEALRLGAHHPALFIIALQLDKWIPNTLFALCLIYFCPVRQNPFLNKKPMCMSILFRKLNDQKSYQDFRQAWLPPVENINNYFDIPVQVITACNVSNTNEIVSIALIWAEPQDALEGYKQYQHTEQQRHDEIDKITTLSTETVFCKIIDVDVLGRSE